jgi:hypothetical protein
VQATISQGTITLDEQELNALIDKRIEERLRAERPPVQTSEPLVGFKAHADHALTHTFPIGGPLADVAKAIQAQGWVQGGEKKWPLLEQAKANLSALPNQHPDQYFRPQRGWIARKPQHG